MGVSSLGFGLKEDHLFCQLEILMCHFLRKVHTLGKGGQGSDPSRRGGTEIRTLAFACPERRSTSALQYAHPTP